MEEANTKRRRRELAYVNTENIIDEAGAAADNSRATGTRGGLDFHRGDKPVRGAVDPNRKRHGHLENLAGNLNFINMNVRANAKMRDQV